MKTSRRGFMGISGALIASRLIPESTHGKSPLDLKPFCADYELSRYDLTQPFAQDGMTYATDGRICVRTGILPPPKNAAELQLPDVRGLPWSVDQKWQPYPRELRVKVGGEIACPVCRGKGRIGAGVEMCDCDDGMRIEFIGDGNFQYEKCDACSAWGYTGGYPCLSCDGACTVDYRVRIGNLGFAPEYDALVRSLGDAEYAIIDYRNECYAERVSVLMFRFDKGEGLLMPCMPEYRRK